MILSTVISFSFIYLVTVIVCLGDCIQEFSFQHQKMAYIVYGSKQIRVVVRLEVWLEIVGVLEVDLVFVGVDHIHLRMLIYSLCALKKRI